MKTQFDNLNDALTYCLEGMYDAEKKLHAALPKFAGTADSSPLRLVFDKYEAGCADKRTKLKRAFSYLLSGPYGRRDKAMTEMITELKSISKKKSVAEVKDVLLANSLRSIISYKNTNYSSAMSLALALELHPVADLIGEILDWENNTDQSITRIQGKLSNRAARIQ